MQPHQQNAAAHASASPIECSKICTMHQQLHIIIITIIKTLSSYICDSQIMHYMHKQQHMQQQHATRLIPKATKVVATPAKDTCTHGGEKPIAHAAAHITAAHMTVTALAAASPTHVYSPLQ